MGKFKVATDLIKLNKKLGLLDAGDVIKIASKAYKVKHFNPKDHLPDVDFFLDEEMERAERRKTLLLAGAAAGSAYLLYKNGDKASKKLGESQAKEIANDAKEKGKKVVSDVKEKGEEIADDVEDKAEDKKDVKKDVEDKVDDKKEEVKEAVESIDVDKSFYK